jgi:hypothetical protein
MPAGRPGSTGVSKYMAQRIWFGDVAAGLADDNGQLALAIEIA